MKTFFKRALPSLLVVLAGFLMSSCRSKIDMDNIDSRAELDLGVALPVGYFHLTMGDLIGDVEKLYIDSNGVIAWRDTFFDGRSFHNVDLADRITTKDFPLDVYDQLSQYATGTTVHGTGVPITLTFDLPLKLKGINDSLRNERLDSAQILTASFFTTLTTSQFDIQWDWISKVTLDLGDQIERGAGKIMTVYDKSAGDTGGFNQKIETAVDNFTLILMKNRNLNPKTDYDKYSGNVVDQTNFKVNMTFVIPVGESVTISQDSKLSYDLSVNFITYKALWGFFKPSSDMFTEEVRNLADSWGSTGFLKDGHLPFSNPEITVDITTELAGVLRISNCYLFAADNVGNRKYATFNGSKILKNVPLFGDFLDPYTSTIGDSTLLWTVFNKDADKGKVDQLFGVMPDSLGYKFEVDFDMQRSPQVRLTPDDSIEINAICNLPMIFHDSVFFQYRDTTNDVNLSQYTIDSLLASSGNVDTVKTSDVRLVLQGINNMPVCLALTVRCLDENGQVVMDAETPSKPFQLFDKDTVRIEAGKYNITPEGGWVLTAPTTTTFIGNMTKKKINQFPSIKSIVYYATIDDKAMKEAHSKGYNNLNLRAERGVDIKMGLTTKIDAILKF